MKPGTPSAWHQALPLRLGLARQAAAARSTAVAVAAAEPDQRFAVPALEIVGFDLILSNSDRRVSGSKDHDISLGSIRRNLRGPWVVDNDPCSVNRFAHPYQGLLHHGAGRASGLSHWEAAALTFAGSAWWEITGEKTPPSRNDQIASGIAGSFLGEPLFRMAHLVLSDRSRLPAAWRNGLAAVVSPGVGLNRTVFGSRFSNAFSDHEPSYDGRLRIGATHAVQHSFDAPVDFKVDGTTIDFAIDYGLPGMPGYTYKRPFDFFTTRVMVSSANGIVGLSTTGLLWGTDTPSAPTTAASGACTAATTTSRRRSSTSPRPRCRWAPPGSGGRHRPWRCRARRWPASACSTPWSAAQGTARSTGGRRARTDRGP